MNLADTLPLLLGAAWLLPLVSFTLIVFVGPRMGKAGVAASYVATGAILGAFVLSAVSLVLWLSHYPLQAAQHGAGHAAAHGGMDHADAGHEARARGDVCSRLRQ